VSKRPYPQRFATESNLEVNLTMSKRCSVCDKGPVTGHNVSHSNVKTNRRWMPNLQTVRAQIKPGLVRRVKVCTSCLKGNKITRATV
jgi:large subunit ribosomal protein L28